MKKSNLIIYFLGFIFISSFLFACSEKTGNLIFKVSFPKNTKILTAEEKKDLNKKIKIKNSELFTNDELSGVLEVVIK